MDYCHHNNHTIDLYSLHFVFIHVIQSQHGHFFGMDNANHPLRTEHHKLQFSIWTLGLHHMQQEDCNSTAANSVFEVSAKILLVNSILIINYYLIK